MASIVVIDNSTVKDVRAYVIYRNDALADHGVYVSADKDPLQVGAYFLGVGIYYHRHHNNGKHKHLETHTTNTW